MNENEKKQIAEQSSDEQDRIVRQFNGSVHLEDYSNWGQSLRNNEVYQSQYKQKYQQQMDKIEKLSLEMIADKYCSNFISHRIQFNPNKFHKSVAINRIDSTINSQIAIYQVNISYFQLNISLLNLDFSFTHQHAIQLIGGGSYGNVYLIEVYGKKYASKNVIFQEAQNFTGNQQQKVYSTLVEYCISKICSALEIGINIEPILGFDLICYSNCIQFFMQYGQPIKDINQQSQFKLLSHLSIMHTIQLVHNDIKPQNIMYSPTLKQNVFIDFGISSFITQLLGQMTKVTFKGSYNYTLNQMKSLFNQKLAGHVDLYFNDLNALSITFKELQNINIINLQQRLSQKNAFKLSQNSQLQKYVSKTYQNKRNPKNMNFIINLVLTVYFLYTQKPFKQYTLEKIQQNIDNPEVFYISLADIITQIPPSSFIFQYFKKLIRSLLIEKNMNDHPLFSIYKENHFIPWLKQDEKKEKKFQSRLQAVQQLLNYHLILLSKPATIEKFLQGFSIKLGWPQKISFYICYLDFMNRNCTKGKQYLVTLMYNLIFSNFHQQHNLTKITHEKKSIHLKKINHLDIEYKHYQILCFIQKEFPKKQILHPEDIWLATKLLQLFQRISDYQKTLSLYNLFLSQPLSKFYKAQCFKYTFDIFAMLQRNPQPRYLPQMKKKLSQMYKIRKQIQNQKKKHNKYNLFFTNILIKISQFFIQVAEFSTINNKIHKINLLESKIKQIQKQFKSQGLTENSIENKIVLHKIYQAKFVLSYLKSDYHHVINYGNLLIEVNRSIQNAGPNKFMSKNIKNIMAQVYLQLGDIQNSKKSIYYDLVLEVGQNFYSDFTNEIIRFKINILQNNLSKAKQNFQHLKLICNDQNKQITLVNNLITFDLKFCDSFSSKQLQSFIQIELQKYLVKIKEWPLKMQQNIQTFKILITFQKLPQTNKKQITQKLISYRKIVAEVIYQKIKNVDFYNKEKIEQIQKGLDQFFINIEELRYFPTTVILLQAPQLFMTIHLKYYELFQTLQIVQKYYKISTKQYPYNHNLISLQLWINYYRFLINNYQISNLFQQLKQILDFIFLSHRELPLIKKRWYDLFFQYDFQINQQSHRFDLTIDLFTQLTKVIIQNKNSYFLIMFHHISKYFFSQICSQKNLNFLLNKILQSHMNLFLIPQFSMFLHSIYQKILTYPLIKIQQYDIILFQILKSCLKISTKGRILLQQNLFQLIQERFSYSLKNITRYSDLHKIKVLNSKYSIQQLYQKQKYYHKKHFKNPYSKIKLKKFKHKKLLFNCLDFTFNFTKKTSESIISLMQSKLQKYQKNKLNLLLV